MSVLIFSKNKNKKRPLIEKKDDCEDEIKIVKLKLKVKVKVNERDDGTYSSIYKLPQVPELKDVHINFKRGYVSIGAASEKVIDLLCDILSITPKDTSRFTGAAPPLPYTLLKRLSAYEVLIPNALYESTGMCPPVPKNSTSSSSFTMRPELIFKGELCDESPVPQKQAVDRIIATLRDSSSICLIAPTGSGKTVMCIAAAARLLKTYRCVGIVCHGVGLVRQWTQRIKTFCPDAAIGKIHQNECDVYNKHFVVISIDSIGRGLDETITELSEIWPGCKKPGKLVAGMKYPIAAFNTIDVVIVDEAHQILAPTYLKHMYAFSPQKSIYTTATPSRGGLLCKQLFWWGGEGIEIKRTFNDPVKVHVTHVDAEHGKTELFLKDGRLAVWLMTNRLSISYARNTRIIEQIVACLAEKRHILVLSDRCKHLRLLFYMLSKLNMDNIRADPRFSRTATIMVQGMSEEEEAAAYNSRIILATYPMFATYRDVITLDTLFLTTPKTHIKQAIGRVLRPCSVKNTVKVFDYVDSFSEFYRGQWSRRYQFYMHPDKDTPYYDKDTPSHFEIIEHRLDENKKVDKEIMKEAYNIEEQLIPDDENKDDYNNEE